jgi:hypothetical protein
MHPISLLEWNRGRDPILPRTSSLIQRAGTETRPPGSPIRTEGEIQFSLGRPRVSPRADIETCPHTNTNADGGIHFLPGLPRVSSGQVRKPALPALSLERRARFNSHPDHPEFSIGPVRKPALRSKKPFKTTLRSSLATQHRPEGPSRSANPQMGWHGRHDPRCWRGYPWPR